MPEVLFQHDAIGDLTLHTGTDEISWAYNLNTANYPTYGGEVVQILSVYIDDLLVKGTVRTYKELEEIYEFFASYITIASQGNDGHGSYNQKPMKMFYAPREWTIFIQPLKVPGFSYALETVTPEWEVHAHIVDQSGGNYETLKEMVVSQLVTSEDFKLKGIISPAAGTPTNNPFSAPGTFSGDTFKEDTAAQTSAKLKEISDFYNELLPAYLKGDYSSIALNIGSKPAFGHKQSSESQESSKETVEKVKATPKK